MFCKICGNKLENGAKFCDKCGNRTEGVSDPSGRETVYEGKIHKCPNCGEILKSFVSNCPFCEYEVRGTNTSSTIKDFRHRLEAIEQQRLESHQYRYSYQYIKHNTPEEDINKKIEKQKIELILNYPIPNTKEDILEFMILACSNFDERQYLSKLSEEDVSDAWLGKIKQCYNKALLVITDNDVLDHIKMLYTEIMSKIGNEKEATSSHAKNSDNKKTGFSSWSLPAKIGWIILNIYTYGIPAIVYYFYRKSKEEK